MATKQARPTVLRIGSTFDASRPSPAWLAKLARHAALYLNERPEGAGAHYLSLAVEHASRAQLAIERGDAHSASTYAMAALQAVWQAELAEGSSIIAFGIKSRTSHAAAGSVGKKLTPKAERQIVADYLKRITRGEKSGAVVTDLAVAWSVSGTTVYSVLRKHGAREKR